MPFTPRVASVIRDALLSEWRTRYLSLNPPMDLSVEEGGDAFNAADAWAKSLEPTEWLAGQAAARVLIRGQFGTELDLTAADDGTQRKAATAAQLSLPVVGPTINSTTAVNGATLSSAKGLRFVPIDPDTGAALVNIVVDGSRNATLTIECTTPGVVGNVPTPTTLTWSTAPTGFAATAATSGITRQGAAAESDPALQARLVERRRSKPGSANPADVRQKLLEFAGVDEVFVHPCMNASGNFALGCITAVVLGPPAGDSTAPGIFYDAPTGSPRAQALMKRFLLGEVDADGEEIPTAEREGFLPAPIHPNNLTVVSPGALDTYPVVTVTTTIDFPPSFVGSYVVAASPPPTTTTFSTTTPIAAPGNPAQIEPGDFIAIEVGPTATRGAFARGKADTGTGGTSVVLAEALPAAPVAGTTVYPTTAVWQMIRDVVFGAYDALGPGLISPAQARHQRFPPESWGRPATIRASQLVARIMAIPGVTDVTVDFGGGTQSVEASARQALRLNRLTIVPG